MSKAREPVPAGDSSENRGLGRVLGCVVAVGSLPILLVGLVVSPLYVGLLRLLARLGWWPRRRIVAAVGETLTFSWFCRSEAEGERALGQAVETLVEIVGSKIAGDPVRSLEFLNPESGFVLDPTRLRRITSDFGSEAARILSGEQVEWGTILINDRTRLENLDLDARTYLIGHLSVDLTGPLDCETLSTLAARHDFELPRDDEPNRGGRTAP